MLIHQRRSFMKLLFFLPLIIPSLWAADYHVDAFASEGSSDGSVSSPFKTITEAADVMGPGDTCYVRRGIYRELLNPQLSGTAELPVRFVAYRNESVVVTATEKVEAWTQHSGAIYKAENVEMNLGTANAVYFNGAVQQLARWPNDLDGDPFTFDAYKIKTEAGTYSDSYITHDEIPDYWTDGVLFWHGAHSGCAVQREITGFDPETKRLSFTPFPDRWPFSTHSPTRMENGHRGIFYLLNQFEALDAPGEWYYDETENTLYFYAPEGVDPSTGSVEIAVRSRSADLNRDYVEVEKINFFGGPLRLNGDRCLLKNLRVRHCVENLIVDSDSATAGGAAVLVYGTDNRIERCLIEEGSATGVNIGANAANTVVENCVIRNFNKQGNHCSPIRSGGARAIITRNRIYGSARDCSRATGVGSVFSYNEVSQGLLANADGGLFYVTGNSNPVDVELHHNWFHGAHSPDYAGEKATGIYLDNDSAGFKVHHNVVWDVGWGGLHFNWDAVQNEIYNNTFWDVGYSEKEEADWAVILCWIPVRNGVPTDVKDNILLNNLSDVREWWDSGAGSMREDETLDNVFRTNLQVLESPFVSFEDMNFMPTEGSSVVNQGEVIAGVTDGFAGGAPDIGAYEFGAERWVPGPDWEPEPFSWVDLPYTFTSWVRGYDLSEPETGVNADPDGDFVPNLMEYLLAGDPSDGKDWGKSPWIAKDGEAFGYVVSVRSEHSDLEVGFQLSESLEPGSWVDLSELELESSDLGTGEKRLTYRFSTEAKRQFVRLRVEEK